MSFDLFVIAPKVDRGTAERFNQSKHADLPEGLRVDPEQCGDDSTFWTMTQGGEEWLELYIDRTATQASPNRPADIAPDWIEIHVPSRGHPTVFHAVAAPAEAAQGWVFDPQGAASELGLDAGQDQATHVARGYYTPAITREIGQRMATQYDLD